jgi:hypothetical protein
MAVRAGGAWEGRRGLPCALSYITVPCVSRYPVRFTDHASGEEHWADIDDRPWDQQQPGVLPIPFSVPAFIARVLCLQVGPGGSVWSIGSSKGAGSRHVAIQPPYVPPCCHVTGTRHLLSDLNPIWGSLPLALAVSIDHSCPPSRSFPPYHAVPLPVRWDGPSWSIPRHLAASTSLALYLQIDPPNLLSHWMGILLVSCIWASDETAHCLPVTDRYLYGTGCTPV